MKRQILIVVSVLAVFIGGLLLGWLVGQRTQETVCVARIAEAKQQEHSTCETLLGKAEDNAAHLNETYLKLQKTVRGSVIGSRVSRDTA